MVKVYMPGYAPKCLACPAALLCVGYPAKSLTQCPHCGRICAYSGQPESGIEEYLMGLHAAILYPLCQLAAPTWQHACAPEFRKSWCERVKEGKPFLTGTVL